MDPRIRILAKLPHLSLTAWEVAGFEIRNRGGTAMEFTNGAHALSKNTPGLAPEGELYIDREAKGAGEQRFWILRQAEEHRLLASGMAYDAAFEEAKQLEVWARKREGLTSPEHAVQLLSKYKGIEVWLRRGRGVRDHDYVDFTLGGNWMRYPYIPEGHAWIDDAAPVRERPALVVHECTEALKMMSGVGYAEAHKAANVAELGMRHRLMTGPGRKS